MIFGKGAHSAPMLPRERASHPRPLLSVSIKPSRLQRLVLIAACVSASVVLWSARLPWWGVLVGSLLIFLYGAYVVRAQGQHAVAQLLLLPDDALEIRCRGEREASPAQLVMPFFVSHFCIALRWTRDGVEPASGAVLITADQLTANDFHALRVRLKYLRTLLPK